jgi:spermidine/putrescine transport system substrate-binding protein
MNFVLDPKVGAAIADFIQYASPNAAAKAIMEDSYTKNLAIFPTEETLANCEASLYQGEDVKRLYDEAWTRIQAA